MEKNQHFFTTLLLLSGDFTWTVSPMQIAAKETNSVFNEYTIEDEDANGTNITLLVCSGEKCKKG